MNSLSLYQFILRSMAANKKRCLLAALGILIGILAVTTLVSLGRSTELSLAEELEKLGTNVLIVEAARTSGGGGRNQSSQGSAVKTLTEDSLNAISQNVTGLASAAPVFQATIDIRDAGQTVKTTMYATTENFFSVRNLELAAGRFFSGEEDQAGQRVVLLGNTVAEQLFGPGAAPGETIRIDNTFFEVIGILEAKGLDAAGEDLDDLIIVPLTVAQRRLTAENHLTHLFLQAENINLIPAMEEQITTTLRATHQINEGEANDFSVMNQTELLSAQTDILGTMSDLVTILAIVILLAGSLGITAVQLINLRERTWEIGLHRALGAPKSKIAVMFLTEAMIMGTAAGIAGIALGLSASFFFAAIFTMPALLSWQAILLSFAISLAASIFGGLYPAYHATRINPSAALRS
ncbi:ABC transporter permease [Dethiobacter alkaliphilus]|uniref:ABC transporter permease n=1 Tax=Dethiobacter alkaliphilus TaxID=427926 RepID=UPI002226297B|nr:ABC transporter permease [Dethiobacter alkaliphilus]MCW3491604.1 ABC transporter permease [Dethiobacter alkaliphilus]